MLHGIALRYFLEVARTGSLAGASEYLHVAVSAISRQISKLEDVVGTRLFERMPKGMVLTEAGELLAQHARRTILEADAVMSEISATQSLGGGIIRVACTEGFTWHFLPSLLAKYHALHPRTRFLARSGTPKQVEQWVVAGDVDLALAFSIAPSPLVNVIYSMNAPLCAVMRSSHPLAEHGKVTLDDVIAYPLATLERGTTARQLLDLCFLARGRPFEPLLSAGNSSLMLEFAALSNAVAIGSAVSLQGMPDAHRMIAVPFDEPLLAERIMQVFAMKDRRLPPPILTFIEMLTDMLDKGFGDGN